MSNNKAKRERRNLFLFHGSSIRLAAAVAAFSIIATAVIASVSNATTAQASKPREPINAGGKALPILNASGYVVARRKATVSARVTGRVSEVLIEEGMAVVKGQVLARLDDASSRRYHELAEFRLESARSHLHETHVRLEQATRTVSRARHLQTEQLISEADLDAAQSELAAFNARLAVLEGDVSIAQEQLRITAQELDDLIVRAPFDGVIVSKDAQPGEVISPTSAGGSFTRTGIATIVDMDSREIEVDVNESFINRVTSGQEVIAVLDAYPDWELKARIIGIVPSADRQKATVKVRIAIDTLDPKILPEMGVKVTVLETARTK